MVNRDIYHADRRYIGRVLCLRGIDSPVNNDEVHARKKPVSVL
jgi:hypothetical protein